MISSHTKKRVFPNIFFIVFLGLIVRLIFIYPQFSGDVKNHLVWGESLLTAGPWNLFSRHFAGFNDANYPALTIYLFGISRWLYHLVTDFIVWQNFNAKFLPSTLVHLFQSYNMEIAFMKIPAMLADLGIGWLIFKLITLRKNSRPLLWVFLYLFNPAVIYISTVWGQIESLPVFFLILSYYLVCKKGDKNYLLSHLAFTLAIMSKQTALWLTPVFLIIWWKQASAKKFIIGAASQLIFFIVTYLPFTNPMGAISSYFSTLGGSSNSITDQAFNLWYFIFGWDTKPDSILILGQSVRNWSLVLVFTTYIYLALRYFRNYDLKNAGNYLFLFSMAAFFLQTRVHDRHLAPAIPSLILTSLAPNKKIVLYLALSAFHMFNLYLALRLPFI